MIAALIVFLFFIIPTFILGLFIRNGKGLMLISGYNTLPGEVRKLIEQRWLAKSAGNMLLRLSFWSALLMVTIYFETTFVFVALAVLLVDAFTSSFRMYSKFPRTRAYVLRTLILAATMAITITGLAILFYFGEREPIVAVSQYGIRIDGMYGREILFSDIGEVKVTLVELPMREIGTGMRRNGYGGFSGTLKGNFEAGLLFVSATSSPTIANDFQNREPPTC